MIYPSVEAKIAAVKSRGSDLVSRMVGSPVIPSVKAPKMPVRWRKEQDQHGDKLIHKIFRLPTLAPGLRRKNYVQWGCAARCSGSFNPFFNIQRPPIIVPLIIARAIGGRLCNLLTKNMPLIEISPAINGKVFEMFGIKLIQ